MPLGTKRYFCAACGAVVEGLGRYCGEGCVTKARAAVGAWDIRKAPPITVATKCTGYTIQDLRKAQLTTLPPEELEKALALAASPSEPTVEAARDYGASYRRAQMSAWERRKHG